MSGSSRRRQSKWDHRDPEALSENLLEKDPPRKPREPPSPSRGSHRHESHRRERTITSDREENDIRTSPGLDDWRHQRRSRSPRNGWGRSYRSRSRSRSRSPAYNSRREPALTEKSRSKICRDFTSGRCRRGNHCLFLHQDAEHYDSRRPLGSSPPDNWESRDRRTGGSRYSADDNKDYSVRSERSVNLCNDFMKGRCRRGSSCRYAHHEGPVADGFERGPADDVYRDRDNDRRIKDTYPDRNHDRETFKRGETLCKFFAAGNCRNGNRCKFSHQVQENFSPERRSQDDRRGSDRKFDGSPACDEPRWSDAVRVSNVHGWGEDKEITGANAVRSGDDSWSHDVVKLKQTWDAPLGLDEAKIGDERQSLQWKTENSGVPTGLTASIGVENFSGDMEISPRDVSKQNGSSLYSQTPSLSNVSFPAVQQDAASETPHDKHYQYGFSEPKAFNDPFAGQNPKFEDKPNIYAAEDRNNVSSDRVCITPNPLMNVRPVQGVFPNDPRVNVRPISSINPPGQSQLQPPLRPSGGDLMQLSTPNPPMNTPLGQGIPHGDQGVNFQLTASMNPPAGQGQLSLPLHPSGGNGMQTSHNPSSFLDNKAAAGPPSDPRVSFRPMSSINPPPAGQGQLSLPTRPPGGNGMQTLHNPSSFLDNKADDGPHLGNANVSTSVTNQSSVSNEQLVQLSHLSASLAQLLENRQQLHLSSAVNPSDMSSLPDSVASVPPVSNATLQPNQAPEPVKQYDPLCDSIERKMPNLGNQMLPSIVEQKSPDNELHPESVNVNQQEPHTVSKDDESDGKIAEGGSKAPENRPSENMAVDDGIDDGKKSKDTKGIRTFKFALADFVKELLKPAWKDGQVSKEAYKTIVKKVVDKVIETQGPQIPQTKEKIDQYLSCSKPKLDKLVQAYVGKYQKS